MLYSGHFRNGDNAPTAAMDVGQLGGHILTRHQIAGVGGALPATSWLSLNGNPEALGGGIGRATEGTAPIYAHGRGGPAVGQ